MNDDEDFRQFVADGIGYLLAALIVLFLAVWLLGK